MLARFLDFVITMVRSYEVSPEIHVLTSNFPIPGFGLVPINAFVVGGSEPLLVDTGAVVDSDGFMRALGSVIDPRALRWLWLTHTDFDHIGSLTRLLADNPRLRVITTFLGMGIMNLASPLPVDRVTFVNPGEKITVGNRTLTALRPPTFDNPSTTGFFEARSQALFSSDCFGALLSAVPDSAADIPEQDLADGQIFWATVDAPWVHKVDASALTRELHGIRQLAPRMVLSSHLPPAPGHMLERLLSAVAAARTAPPFVGPDQATFQQMLGAAAAAAR